MRAQVRNDLAVMEGYHSPQVAVTVRLNTNESPVPPPAELSAALADAAASVEWHRYPDRRAMALRRAIGEGYGVDPDQVLVANGSNEVLQTILLGYAGTGRTVAVFEPTYAMHSQIAKVVGSSVVMGHRGEDFCLDLDDVRRVVVEHQPAVVFLCSPNNPTGTVDPNDTVETVLGLVEPYGGLVVVDEAYGQFAPRSAIELVSDDHNLVVTRTFSKTWSMAALRLGYLVGPSWLVAALEDIVLPYHLDAFKQQAGLLALQYRQAMVARVAALVEERGRLIAALSELPVEVWPSGANFVLFRPRNRHGRAVWKALVERSVLVRDCSSWPGLEDCLRVTIGTPYEDDAFLAALSEALV